MRKSRIDAPVGTRDSSARPVFQQVFQHCRCTERRFNRAWRPASPTRLALRTELLLDPALELVEAGQRALRARHVCLHRLNVAVCAGMVWEAVSRLTRAVVWYAMVCEAVSRVTQSPCRFIANHHTAKPNVRFSAFLLQRAMN
jgi:hypothetical protein